jgi:PAS domain S-box-containing protein
MAAPIIKRKKTNNHLADRKGIQPPKVKEAPITESMFFKQVGKQPEEEIKKLKQQMEFILGVTKTGLDIIDSEFNIRYIDPEWAKVYGDPTGRKCYEYFMGGKAPCPDCGITKALKTKKPTVTEEILSKENNRPIQVTTIPFQNSKGEWLVAEVNVDIAERKQAEDALSKAHDELEIGVQKRTAQLASANEAMQLEISERKRAEEALQRSEEEAKRLAQENTIMAEIGRIITSSLNIDEVYDRFTEEVRKLIPFDRVVINIINSKDGTMTISYASGMDVKERRAGATVPLQGSGTEACLARRSSFLYQTESIDEIAHNFPALLPTFQAGIRSIIYVPLISKDRVIGILSIRSKKANAYSGQELRLAEGIGSQIAGAIANAQLFTDHKQTEEKLRESEEKYRTILENIEDGYYEVDLPGNFTFFNDSLCRMLGYSRDEMIGMGNHQYTDQENRKKLFQAFNQVFRTGEPIKGFDWEIMRKDGAKRFGEISISLIKDSTGQPIGFRGIARDITERKRAEEMLRESEEKYRNLVDNAPIGIYKTDLKGNILFANQSLSKMFEFDFPEQMISDGLFSRYKNPNDREILIGILREKGKVTNHEIEVLTKSGKSLNVLLSATFEEGILSGMIKDITERKQAEEELSTEKQKFQTLSEQAPFGLMMINKDGVFKYINPKFKQLFGYDLSDVPNGKTWFRKAYPDPTYRHHVISDWLNDLERTESGEKRSRVYRATCKDGTEKIVNFISVQLEKGENLVACEDITERKRAEEEIRRTLSLLNATLESTADGILVVDRAGRIESFNRKFVQMWHIPKSIIASQDDDRALAFVLDQLKDPEGFFSKVKDLYNQPEAESFDLLEFKDGRVFERYSQPQWIGEHSVGRVWSFRDVSERWRAEEALRESEEKYRELADFLPEMVFETDQTGKLLFANRRAFETFGYTKEDFDGGLGLFEMVVPEDRERVTRNIEILFKEGKVTGNEYTALRKDGTTFPVLASPNLIIRDDKPVGIRGIAIDITERKQAEEALKTSEEKYRLLVENAGEAIFVAQDGMLKFANRNTTEMIGYSKEELTSKPFMEFIHPDDRGLVLDRHLKRLEGHGLPSVYPFRIVKKSGNVKWVELNAVLINWEGRPATLNFLSDITERKEAEEALQESEKKFRVLTETAASGIFIHQGDKFVYVNPASEAMTGYSREELLTMDFWDLVHPDFRELVRQRAQARQEGKSVPSRYELKIITKNGEERWVDLAVGMINFQGKPAILGTDFDITERKRAEEEMRALEEQLRQSQKIEAIGRLAGGIAHDFNNVLTVIKGYGQLSLLDLKESDPLWGNIQEIQKAAQRATDLTRHLLAFSRRQILDLKVLDLNSLLKDLDKMLRRIIGEDIELSTLLANDLGRVKIDPGQIEQVILNLAVNARDAMPSGGKLSIETSNVELDREYSNNHVGVIPGHYVRLSVSDTGVGMSKDVEEKIFEPFFTTKEKGKGTGLGLSTVYGIVKQSGGNIWVYSEPGHGTTFKIYLPRVDEALDALNGRDGTDSLPRGSETVLLVEDEPLVRDLARRLLSQQGYSILEAADGREALRIAQECAAQKIHLLLTDVVMPKMGGKELAEQIKPLRPDIKVLYTSGYTDDAIVHHGVLDPGTQFLQKPFSLKTLSRKVREVLDR